MGVPGRGVLFCSIPAINKGWLRIPGRTLGRLTDRGLGVKFSGSTINHLEGGCKKKIVRTLCRKTVLEGVQEKEITFGGSPKKKFVCGKPPDD